MPCPRARCDLGWKTRAHERSDDQHFTHKFAFAPFCSNWGSYREGTSSLSRAPTLYNRTRRNSSDAYSIGMSKSSKYQREPARKQASRRRPGKGCYVLWKLSSGNRS